MSIKKFCHVKKNDKVIVLTGDFRRTIGVVTNVKRKKNFDDKFFVIIDSLPKKRLKNKKTNEYVEKEVLVDSSNVKLLKINRIEN